MSAQLSIVIATRNAAGCLPATIEPLMEGLRGGLIRDLIIADGGSTDDTLRIADAVGADILNGMPTRQTLVQQGIEQAQGRWALVLVPGTRLHEGWSEAVGDHIRDQTGPACFRLVAGRGGLGTALRCRLSNLRTSVLGMARPEHGLLLSRGGTKGGRVRMLDAAITATGRSDDL